LIPASWTVLQNQNLSEKPKPQPGQPAKSDGKLNKVGAASDAQKRKSKRKKLNTGGPVSDPKLLMKAQDKVAVKTKTI
jgi:hypothetical protein